MVINVEIMVIVFLAAVVMASVLNERSNMVAIGWNKRTRDRERRLERQAIWGRVEDILR